MNIVLTIGHKSYKCNLGAPLDISIPLKHKTSPIAFGAPPFVAEPFELEGFIGAIEHGSPVNFYNLRINPHGNGTHTETVKHIDNDGPSIAQVMKKAHFISRLVTMRPEVKENGDQVLTKESFVFDKSAFQDIEALIIRTKPNRKQKKSKNYTNTNPPYLDASLIKHFNTCGIRHLLIDLPSVDREIDGGKLKSHKTFWLKDKFNPQEKTITEMVFVDNDIKDGLYLLNLQTISLDIDVSPSKPVLYSLLEA